jgi:hypothetical protein
VVELVGFHDEAQCLWILLLLPPPEDSAGQQVGPGEANMQRPWGASEFKPRYVVIIDWASVNCHL